MKSKRQEQIYQMIQEEGHVKIRDLSEKFEVSEMTIHRDLKLLMEQGLVKKIFGGVQLQEVSNKIQQKQCTYCHKPISNEGKLTYQLILSANRIERTCCAHCGILRHKQLGEVVLQALCHDFMTNTTISATTAWFVMDTSLQMGCCEPQVLTFGNKDHAEKFVKGFEGTVLRFEEAAERVTEAMQASCCSKQK
ncbi:DeoR family transcriptional regulator [Oceanobacillus sojae]|uniref:DeoR family transcriptional regulator n=1 Tax=Oceanobacillus sojae TaxID=582851 RepID=UPI0011BF9077|nr:DeoR family transcriptional regulator [Oceanobacillus sojae]